MTDQGPSLTDALPRGGPDERDYLLRRAESHRRLAERAGETGSQKVHARLQQLYEDRAGKVDLVDRD